MFVWIISACAPATALQAVSPPNPPAQTTEPTIKFEITSPAFTNEGSIPIDYSCRGRDISPPLAWTQPLSGTQSFALIVDDPDAGATPWVHWLMFNIPASARGLDERMPTDEQLSDGSTQGRTSAGTNGYHGPCPPSGIHRYFFKLYALDTILSLSSEAKKDALLAAMEGHIVANIELMGTFSK